MSDIDASLLSSEIAAFLEGGQLISLASRDVDYRPSMASALACRVAADLRSLTILLPRMQAWQLLADVAGSGRLAAVFSQPRSHRSIQIKARNAIESVPDSNDIALIASQTESAALALKSVGYDADLLGVMFEYAVGDLTAIELEVDEIFDQSPGPRAGQRLGQS
jgi:hypothetical protein